MKMNYCSTAIIKGDETDKEIACFTNSTDVLEAFNDLVITLRKNKIKPEHIKAFHVEKDESFKYEGGEVFLSANFIKSMLEEWETVVFQNGKERKLIDNNNHPAWMLSERIKDKTYNGFHHSMDFRFIGWSKLSGIWMAVDLKEKKMTFPNCRESLANADDPLKYIADVLVEFSGDKLREIE